MEMITLLRSKSKIIKQLVENPVYRVGKNTFYEYVNGTGDVVYVCPDKKIFPQTIIESLKEEHFGKEFIYLR